jgi:hypothetical protein
MRYEIRFYESHGSQGQECRLARSNTVRGNMGLGDGRIDLNEALLQGINTRIDLVPLHTQVLIHCTLFSDHFPTLVLVSHLRYQLAGKQQT